MKGSPFWLLRRPWETKKLVGNVAEEELSVISSLWSYLSRWLLLIPEEGFLFLFCFILFVSFLLKKKKTAW